MKNTFSLIFIVSFCLTTQAIYAQNNNYNPNNDYNYMTLPPKDSLAVNAGTPPPYGYDSGKVYGYWFVAPADLVITGLETDTQTGGSGGQIFQVMKLQGSLALYPDSGTNFTTLYHGYMGNYIYIDSVNIPIAQGDTIGIIGELATTISLSSPNTPFSTQIGNDTVKLNAFFTGGVNLLASPASWYSTRGAGSRIGRVGMFYSLKPTGIAVIGGENPLSVFPNPATGNQLLLKGLQQPAVYEVTNLTGRLLLSGETNSAETAIDIHRLSPGMYWIRIQTEKQTQHFKFIKL